MINKIKTIIFSRFKKPNTESFVEMRRGICKKCPLNTKNNASLSLKIRITKYFSDKYSFFTGKKKLDDLGNCSVCGCSIYFMTANSGDSCSSTPKKWTRIENTKNK